MIQRLQSIFLFLGSLSCFSLFGLDVADAEAPIAGNALFADGEYDVYDDTVLLVIFALAGVLLLADIFLFKNRPLQSKLAMGAVALAIGGAGWLGFQWGSHGGIDISTPDFGMAVPILVILFALLGRKHIIKDEKLVRSADRLR